MIKIILFVVGVTVGGVWGIVIMSLMQINRINAYERKIMRMKKELRKLRAEDNKKQDN